MTGRNKFKTKTYVEKRIDVRAKEVTTDSFFDVIKIFVAIVFGLSILMVAVTSFSFSEVIPGAFVLAFLIITIIRK